MKDGKILKIDHQVPALDLHQCCPLLGALLFFFNALCRSYDSMRLISKRIENEN